jgi:DNA recombination protein RmuC
MNWEFVTASIIVASAILIAGLIVKHAFARNSAARDNSAALDMLGKSVQALSAQLSQALADTSRNVGDRLDNTTRVVGDVRQKLGQIEESSRRVMQIGEDISKLQDILQPPKLRGSLGELFLAELLAQVLPPSHFKLQHQFKGGETVDAAILLSKGLVPVDAKFPLENFKRIISSHDDEEKKTARKAFVRDVKTHIDAISSKYIRMDENTFDFALMYIPAENVYYETIIKDDEFGGDMNIFSYAMKKKVVPVSPNSFYAYLQTIILGLRGMRVEEQSREIIEKLSRLSREMDAFAEAFRLVGQHLENMQKKYAEAQKRFGTVEVKFEQINGLAGGLEKPAQTAEIQPPPADRPDGRAAV